MITEKKASQVIAKLKKKLKTFDNHAFDKKCGFFDVVYAEREYLKENLVVEFYFKSLDCAQIMKFANAFHHLRPFEFTHENGFVKVDNGISRANVKADFCPNSGATGPMICFEIFFNDFNKFLNDGK